MEEPLKKKVKIDFISNKICKEIKNEKKNENSRLYKRRNALWNIYIIK